MKEHLIEWIQKLQEVSPTRIKDFTNQAFQRGQLALISKQSAIKAGDHESAKKFEDQASKRSRQFSKGLEKMKAGFKKANKNNTSGLTDKAREDIVLAKRHADYQKGLKND